MSNQQFEMRATLDLLKSVATGKKILNEGISNADQDPNLAKAYRMGYEAYKAYRNDPELAQAAQDKIEAEFPQYAEMWLRGYRDGETLPQGVAEGKRADRYHIVNKDGKPANLASYADRASAAKDRDEKYPGATVQKVGPRGKVKDVTEGIFSNNAGKEINHDSISRLSDEELQRAYKFSDTFSIDPEHAATAKALRDEIKKRKQGVAEGSDNLVIGQQMARDGIEYDPAQEGEIISQIGDYLKRSGMTPRQIRGYMIDNDFVSDQLSYLPRKSELTEDRPDVMRHRGDKTVKVVKRGGKPVGEIGIDAEASGGNGQYYVKLYDGSYDASGFDTAEEALAELKYAVK